MSTKRIRKDKLYKVVVEVVRYRAYWMTAPSKKAAIEKTLANNIPPREQVQRSWAYEQEVETDE